MIAPFMRRGLTLRFEGEPVSLPYIRMTLGMMAQRGVEAELQPLQITVPPGSYRAFSQPSEGIGRQRPFGMRFPHCRQDG